MNFLVTGSGCPGWMSTYDAIRELFPLDLIYGCDIHSSTAGSVLATKHHIVPAGTDLTYLSSIENIVRDYQIDVIVPLTDPELVSLALAVDKLADLGCSVLVSSPDILSIALNKELLYKTLPELSPAYERFSSLKDINSFIRSNSDNGTCFIKGSVAYGSRGTKRIVSDSKWLESFSNQKPEAFGMMFPVSFVDQLPQKESLILVEDLPGQEYSIDCLFSGSGNLVFYGIREREVTRNGICHTAKFIVDRDREFGQFVSLVAHKLPLKYNVNIQVKRDRQGALKLLEINPRISGSLGAFFSVGYNLAGLGIYYLLHPLADLEENLIFTPSFYRSPRAYRVSSFIQG